MLMADTLAIFLVVFGFLLALPGLWLLCLGLWPKAVGRTCADCSAGLLLPFLVGLPISLVAFFATSFASTSLGPASGFVSIAIVCLYVLFASIGIAGLTTAIGKRLPSPADIERPWKATIRGSIVMELAFLLPLLGWFLLLPSALIIGSGAALRAMLKGMKVVVKRETTASGEAEETISNLGNSHGVA
ncbi:hypothetical protein BH11CYA1_BH11CYA1_21110 [soil metagenome]